jgi:hypothetical protein
MFFSDLFAALLFGAIIVFSLSRTFSTKGPWGSLPSFFIVVALFAWVAAVWLRPYGPLWFGVGWMPIIFVGFLTALLLTTASPRERWNRASNKKESEAAGNRKADVDVFFWILILCLAMLAMSHFFWFPQFGWN